MFEKFLAVLVAKITVLTAKDEKELKLWKG
jgi:hypothetical protein